MKSSLIKIILSILSGKMSKEEETEILQRKSVLSTMQQQWEDSDGDVSDFNKQKVWNQLERKTHDRVIVPEKNNRIRRLVIWSAAACLALLFGIGYYSYRDSSMNPDVRMLSAETRYQERITIILPDSTKVWLNAGSRIEYPEIFSDSIRKVKLSGEAYFEVAHNKQQAFVVSTDNLQIRVLGTRFAVSDYEKDNNAETVLVSGKVRVDAITGSERQQFDLSPNNQLLFDTGQQSISIQGIDASQHIGWVSGKLTFDDAALGVVISRLERWYGIEIEYPEELSGKDYLFTFTIRNETLEQMIQLMQNMISVKFVLLENNRYIIRMQ